MAVTVLRVCAQFQTSITVTSCSAPSVISGVPRFLPVLVFHTFRTVVRRGNRDIGVTRLRGGRLRKRDEFTNGAKTSSLKRLAPPDFYSVRAVCCLSRCKGVRTLS